MILRKTLLTLYKAIVLNFFSAFRISDSYFADLLHKHLDPYLKTTEANIDGHQMLLDSKDSLNLSIFGVYEPLETELIKKIIKTGDTVIDIGANIGYYTLILARLVGKEGKVFAFEPEQSNFCLLNKNIKINNYNNIKAIKKAVSNKTGQTDLYISEENKGDHKIYYSGDNRQSVKIDVTRLDDYFLDFKGEINLVKIDIQGAEGGAIEGMNKILQKNKNLKIISEFWPKGLKDFGTDGKDFLQFFSNKDFKIYQIEEKIKKIKRVTISYLLNKYTYERGNFTNLLLFRDFSDPPYFINK